MRIFQQQKHNDGVDDCKCCSKYLLPPFIAIAQPLIEAYSSCFSGYYSSFWRRMILISRGKDLMKFLVDQRSCWCGYRSLEDDSEGPNQVSCRSCYYRYVYCFGSFVKRSFVTLTPPLFLLHLCLLAPIIIFGCCLWFADRFQRHWKGHWRRWKGRGTLPSTILVVPSPALSGMLWKVWDCVVIGWSIFVKNCSSIIPAGFLGWW